MTVEKVICDECGRVKGEANHWHEVAVWQTKTAMLAVACGMCADQLVLERVDPPVELEIHDLCGEQCLYKHIGKLLNLNHAPEEI